MKPNGFQKGKWHPNQGGKYDGGHPTKQKQAGSAGWNQHEINMVFSTVLDATEHVKNKAAKKLEAVKGCIVTRSQVHSLRISHLRSSLGVSNGARQLLRAMEGHPI